jgi:hypothetical protein
MMSSLVICYSGVDYAERPLAFEWEGEKLQINKIVQRWRSPQGLGFQVMTDDQQLFELFYDLLGDTWQVNLI